MDGEKAEANWESKYKNLKSKLKELIKIRHDSVRIDTQDLKQKIEEHKKVHEISIKELKQQNIDLQEYIKDIQDQKNEVERLKRSNSTIRQNLRRYDKILSEFMNYPKFSIECIGYHLYKITCDVNTNLNQRDSLIFKLGYSSDSFQYTPINIPDGLKPGSEFLRDQIEFSVLNSFVQALLRAL